MINIDIKKENPLKTILKAGKIPVVRVSNEGFKNYNQFAFEERHKDDLKGRKIFNGCFVHVGGIQGRWISGWHIQETLHIGYLEPDTKIFCTFKAAKLSSIKEFDYNTAAAKFEDTTLGYKEWFEDLKVIPGNVSGAEEDFDQFAEAIVRKEDIVDVLALEERELYKFLPYVSDKHLKLLSTDDIFYSLVRGKSLSKRFLKHMDALDFFKTEGSLGCGDFDIFNNTHDFLEYSSLYQETFLNEFYNFYTKNPYKYTDEEIIEMKNTITDFVSWKKKESDLLKGTSKKKRVFFNTDYLHVVFEDYFYLRNDNIKKLSITISKNKLDANATIANPEYRFDNLYKNLTFEDLFQNKYRPYLFIFLEIYDKYVETFSKYFEISKIEGYEKAKAYKNLYEKLHEHAYYPVLNDKEWVLTFNEPSFNYEYNLILKDGVIEIFDSEKTYYNVDNLPKEFESCRFEELNYILKIFLEDIFMFKIFKNQKYIIFTII